MKKASWMFLVCLLLNVPQIMGQATAGVRINPQSCLFFMNDGEFVGTKGVMCGLQGSIALTYNEGQKWRNRNWNPYADYKQVCMIDTSNFYLLSDTLLVKSKFGGQTYITVYVAPAGERFVRLRVNGQQVWVLSVDKTNSAQAKLIKGEHTWTGTPQIINIPFASPVDFEFLDAQTGVFITDDKIYKTHNGGMDFSLVYTAGGSDHLKVIRRYDSLVLMVGGEFDSKLKAGTEDKTVSSCAVWKSVDGGEAWDFKPLPLSLSQNSSVYKLVFKDANTVVAGLRQKGESSEIWPAAITYNGGNTWDAVQTDAEMALRYSFAKTCWTMVSANYYWVFETTGFQSLFYFDNSKVLLSKDVLITTNIKDISARVYGSRDLFLISEGVYDQMLYSSGNFFGYEWQPVNAPSLAPSGHIDRVEFADYSFGLANSGSGSLSTYSGGNTWMKYEHYDPRLPKLEDLCFPYPTAAYRRLVYQDINTLENKQLLQKSSNQGYSWVDLPTPGENVNKMIFTSAGTGFLFGGDDQNTTGGLYMTTDGGAEWTWYPLDLANITMADMVDASRAFVITADNKFYVLHMQSAGVVPAEKNIPQGVTLTGLDFSTNAHGVLLTEDSRFTKVYATNNAGQTWSLVHFTDEAGYSPPVYTSLPKGIKYVKLTNNNLNGYLFGKGNRLIHLDDGFPLGETNQAGAPLSVFPNPAGSQITFQAGPGRGILEIFSVSGALFYQSEQDFPAKLGLTDWPSGVYFYRIILGTGIYTGKFIRN